MPPATLPPGLDRLGRALDVSVESRLHFPDPLEVDPGDVWSPPATIPILGPLNSAQAIGGFEPWIAGGLTGDHSLEEGGKGPIQPPQGGLLGRERPLGDVGADLTDLFQLGRLSLIADADPEHLPDIPALLKCSVVELLVRLQAAFESHVLLGSRAQSELAGPSHAALSHWCSMHLRTVCSETYPTDAPKYDFDHRTWGAPSQGNSERRIRLVRPLNARTTSAGEPVGRTQRKMCTWSNMTSEATISHWCSSAIWVSSSSRRRANRPPKIRWRYFVHHTRCRPSEVTPPALRRSREDDMFPPYAEGVTFRVCELTCLSLLEAQESPLLALRRGGRHEARAVLVGQERRAGHAEVNANVRLAVSWCVDVLGCDA